MAETPRGPVSRFHRYDGGDPLKPPVDLAEALDAIGEDVMAGYSPERALNEFLRRVVRTGMGALLPGGEIEGRPAVGLRDPRLEFEQALIDRTEFFDVERGVVHAHELAGVGIAEEREISQATKERGVVERSRAEGAERAGIEEIAT